MYRKQAACARRNELLQNSVVAQVVFLVFQSFSLQGDGCSVCFSIVLRAGIKVRALQSRSLSARLVAAPTFELWSSSEGVFYKETIYAVSIELTAGTEDGESN